LAEEVFARHRYRQFVTMVVDQRKGRLKEVVQGKTIADLRWALDDIEGRENVKVVVCDLCDPYKSFARQFFPNAQVVADKFHVLRLCA
jgi:transposase